MENNIDRKKILEALAGINKNAALSKAVENKDVGAIMSALPKEKADELRAIMENKAAMDNLLSSPMAQEILRKFGKNGKQ